MTFDKVSWQPRWLVFDNFRRSPILEAERGKTQPLTPTHGPACLPGKKEEE
jgi:hypothetical protein